MRTHAVVTLLLGALYAIYHTVWAGRANSEAPFAPPDWLVIGQLTWGFVSFAMIFLYQREDRSPVLPALYVTFTGATYSYVWFLEATRGAVEDEMVPTWWKVFSAIVGLILMLEGLRQARMRIGRSRELPGRGSVIPNERSEEESREAEIPQSR